MHGLNVELSKGCGSSDLICLNINMAIRCMVEGNGYQSKDIGFRFLCGLMKEQPGLLKKVQ